jgi:hypothetical protein
VSLWLRALTGAQDASAFQNGFLHPVSEFQSVAAARHLIAAALCDQHGAPLLSYEQSGRMTVGEAQALGGAVIDGLERISPAYWRSNIDAWAAALKRGAQHHTNIGATIQIGQCHDIVSGMSIGTSARPDRYFGKPVIHLTDGQLMAFAAARAAYSELKT